MKLRSTRLAAAIAVAGALSFAAPVFAQSSSSAPDNSNNSSMESGAREMYHGTKNSVKDTAVTAKVKEALLTDKMTKAYTIHVDTDNNGIVTLTGEVPSMSVAKHAEELAQNVSGVRSVQNELQVKNAMR